MARTHNTKIIILTTLTPAPSRSSVLMVPLFLASLFALMAAICSMDMASPRDQIWSVMAPPFVLPVCLKMFSRRTWHGREREGGKERGGEERGRKRKRGEGERGEGE